ncbi:uncharacterized protein TrAFT101_010627 [Trichoderma asperellum]|uniref:uncharacterized protein n=1 Tax=Trichoderma asperellum TaxID=101201 RepID=UPI00331D0F5B|nr:hypothetical protein TrAFT101_010627 [Trichoderma asperellum]
MRAIQDTARHIKCHETWRHRTLAGMSLRLELQHTFLPPKGWLNPSSWVQSMWKSAVKIKKPIIVTDATQKATRTSAIHATTEIPSGHGDVPYGIRQLAGHIKKNLL